MDHVPPRTGKLAPVHTQVPRAKTRDARPLCANECSSGRHHPPGDRSLRNPLKPTGHHHTVGLYTTKGAHPRLPTNNPVPPAPAGQPEHRFFCRRLRRDEPHTGSWQGCFGPTAGHDEPSLASWLGPAEQHTYRSMPMPAVAVEKIFEHLHAVHDALAGVVGRRQPSPGGSDPMGGDPPKSRKQLVAAFLWYDTLAACAPAAYQVNPARHGVHSEAALPLMETYRGASPAFRPATQGQLQEELERQAAALEEDIRHLRALLPADRKRAIKDFWRHHAQDIVQRWRGVRGATEMEAPRQSGLWNAWVPKNPNAPDEGP